MATIEVSLGFDAATGQILIDGQPYGGAVQVVDLDESDWDSIKEAASKSTWIPPDYYQNDWVSDVRAFLRGELEGQYPTMDAYMASCRALHWRTEQLKQAGIEPADLNKIAASLPMVQGDIGMRFPDLPHYPPEDYRFPITEAFKGDDHRQLYHAWRRYPRAMRITIGLFLMLGMIIGIAYGWFVYG